MPFEKKKKLEEWVMKKKSIAYTSQDICEDLFEIVRNQKMEDGSLLCEPFLRMPKRREDPEYYTVISKPMDISVVGGRVKEGEYVGVEEMERDFNLIIANATAFYPEDSKEAMQAKELDLLFKQSKQQLTRQAAEAICLAASNKQQSSEKEEKCVAEEVVVESEEQMATEENTPSVLSHPLDDPLSNASNTAPTSITPNNSPVKPKTEGGLDESSRSGFSNTVTSGSEMDDEMRLARGVVDGRSEAKKRKKGRRRTNKEIQEARMLEMGDDSVVSEQGAEEDEGCMIEQLFSSTIMSSEGLHTFTELFKIVPSKNKCPIYHQVVKEPMDLRTVARKIQALEYCTVDDMINDFMLIVANAKSYNEPHTRTYKEANSMKKHLLNKRQELEQRKQMRSQRTRCRNQFQSVGNMSSVFAALKSESEDERAGSEGEMGEGGHGNEQWVLFDAVKSHKDASDVVLSEPFLRLPSKRFYPDYFQEIKRPMSLMKIQKKIKSGAYVGLEMVARDFELVFENAMQYNRDDSRIYKDAETLLGIVRSKVEEMVKEKRLSDSQEEEGRKKPRLSDEALKRNLYSLYRSVLEHQEEGRSLIEIFMRLPSKRDYPDYYDIITRPIDMTTIEYKIKNDRYHEMQSLVDDFKLMFKNARLYNKEMSQVFIDATSLDKVVSQCYHTYLEQLESAFKAAPIQAPPPEVKKAPVLSAFNRACLQKLQESYGLVCNYKDSSGRSLSAPFLNLPLKSEYPDYYETISKPMDLTRVYQRIVSGGYPLLDDIFNDLSLIFTNACLYNEPDSQIYKDAVSLQRVCSERKAQWNDQAEVPSVDATLQKLLQLLVAALLNHKDTTGRVYSNSLHEVNMDSTDSRLKPMKSLELMQREVEAGMYRRLDSLQENLISFFEHLLVNFKHDKQLVEDCVKLMKALISTRDHLCGVQAPLSSSSSPSSSSSSSSPLELESLASPALSYDVSKLQTFLEENGVDVDEEEEDDEDEAGEGDSTGGGKVACESVQSGGEVYSAGDFVYIRGCSKIVEIRKTWKLSDPTAAASSSLSASPSSWIEGRVFLPPQLTKHHPRRTFLQKEVFMTSQKGSFRADVIGGRCLVLSVFLYSLYEPSIGDPIREKDVFVCESKYNVQCNVFTVLKHWKPHKEAMFKRREKAVCLLRSPLSVVSKAPPLATPAPLVDTQRVVVQLVNLNPSDPNVYYEQICTPNKLWIKIGDFVVTKVVNAGEKARIVRVERIWCTSRGESHISGPMLLYPSEVSHHGNRSFYRKELLLSNKEVTQACSSLSHTCSVMGVVDYCTKRVIGCAEEWVFVCDLKYTEADKSFKKIMLPIKQAGLSDQVCADEVLVLKRPIVIAREQLETPVVGSESAALMEEESMDFFPSTETSSAHDSASFISESFSATNISTANNTNLPNGSLAAASNLNGGVKDDAASSVKKRKKRSSTTKVRNVTGYIVYAGECRKNIQAEFPDLNFGDISRAVGTRWKSLPRDLKEKYEERARQLTQDLSRGSEVLASPAAPDSRSMSPATLVSVIHSKSLQTQQQSTPTILPTIDLSASHNNVNKLNHGPAIFVDVPPQTYKVAHSEAYIRYIHGLAQGNKFIGDFNKTLWAKKPEPLSVDTTKLPSHWLANGPGHHGDVVSAFWALRQHMLNDALRIDRVLN